MPQQTNGNTDIEASNILPVKNNISNSGTYKNSSVIFRIKRKIKREIKNMISISKI